MTCIPHSTNINCMHIAKSILGCKHDCEACRNCFVKKYMLKVYLYMLFRLFKILVLFNLHYLSEFTEVSFMFYQHSPWTYVKIAS